MWRRDEEEEKDPREEKKKSKVDTPSRFDYENF